METFHEILDQPLSNEEWVESILGANLTCRDRLEEEGIDLSAYTSSEMAADVNDIRQALGYDVVNLFGVSYGTRTALTLMRDYPEIVRSAILDSPIPLEVDILGANAISSDDARNLLFERCAEDPICDAAFPDLQGAFDQLAEQLEANSITIPVTHLATNETYDVWVDSGILGASIIEALYNSETIVYVPKMIYDTLGGEEGSYDALSTSLEIYLFYMIIPVKRCATQYCAAMRPLLARLNLS
jgi:pimeloyl-ACP methyl ester carboxylesterase